ncbi:uncharacterized protein EV154DRAFT_28141 [Mucor mucedo]|uniref:uncharacterized protein n=1 Tax=Mucor mucedo TaxID=29922 RepID=UPI00221EC6C9|nr:uncharacterized protein EV154DRAFT_28141 [Mucor mucedo]KAI7884118.1 hypothetical protein EV154DRAFT_28141 [Mucor mucedo]
MNDNKVDGLPPIQLPPTIVHYYIASAPLPEATVKKSNKEGAAVARRSSHSAVEKRRRERMNDKIERLKDLLPACNPYYSTSVQQPIHKLSVLQASIDYIGQLHHQLEMRLPEDSPLLKDISAIRDRLKKNQEVFEK